MAYLCTHGIPLHRDCAECDLLNDRIQSIPAQLSAARAEGFREGLEAAAVMCDDYNRDGRNWKEYAAETADELAARIRALAPKKDGEP